MSAVPTSVQWSKLNEYLLQVTTIHQPHDFCVAALDLLPKLISYDQGIVYFLDETASVYDEYLVGVSEKAVRAYHLHVFDDPEEESEWSVSAIARQYADRIIADAKEKERLGRVPTNPITSMDFSRYPHDSRFYRECVRPRGIRFSTGFGFFDMRGRVRVVFCLDRTRNVDYSHDELTLLELVAMHLGNTYVNFHAEPPLGHGDTLALATSDLPLTAREREIASLILQGSSAKAVADRLGISRETVYKHVNHIHAKLGVSNQAELIARLRESVGR